MKTFELSILTSFKHEFSHEQKLSFSSRTEDEGECHSHDKNNDII